MNEPDGSKARASAICNSVVIWTETTEVMPQKWLARAYFGGKSP
jgi:hypothetical protein